MIERLVTMLSDPVSNVRQKAYKTLETLAKPSDNWFNAALAMKLLSRYGGPNPEALFPDNWLNAALAMKLSSKYSLTSNQV